MRGSIGFPKAVNRITAAVRLETKWLKAKQAVALAAALVLAFLLHTLERRNTGRTYARASNTWLSSMMSVSTYLSGSVSSLQIARATRSTSRCAHIWEVDSALEFLNGSPASVCSVPESADVSAAGFRSRSFPVLARSVLWRATPRFSVFSLGGAVGGRRGRHRSR